MFNSKIFLFLFLSLFCFSCSNNNEKFVRDINEQNSETNKNEIRTILEGGTKTLKYKNGNIIDDFPIYLHCIDIDSKTLYFSEYEAETSTLTLTNNYFDLSYYQELRIKTLSGDEFFFYKEPNSIYFEITEKDGKKIFPYDCKINEEEPFLYNY